jgi:hypothetical protein
MKKQIKSKQQHARLGLKLIRTGVKAGGTTRKKLDLWRIDLRRRVVCDPIP